VILSVTRIAVPPDESIPSALVSMACAASHVTSYASNIRGRKPTGSRVLRRWENSITFLVMR